MTTKAQILLLCLLILTTLLTQHIQKTLEAELLSPQHHFEPTKPTRFVTP